MRGTQGGLGWHPASSRFHGAGVSARGIRFHIMQIGRHLVDGGLSFHTQQSICSAPHGKLYVVPLGSVEVSSLIWMTR